MPHNTPAHPPVSQDEARKELRRAALDYSYLSRRLMD
jgi:hypothetical protein